jgi:hypothetical protein
MSHMTLNLCTYNVTLRHVHVTVVTVEEQYALHIKSVYVILP